MWRSRCCWRRAIPFLALPRGQVGVPRAAEVGQPIRSRAGAIRASSPPVTPRHIAIVGARPGCVEGARSATQATLVTNAIDFVLQGRLTSPPVNRFRSTTRVRICAKTSPAGPLSMR